MRRVSRLFDWQSLLKFGKQEEQNQVLQIRSFDRCITMPGMFSNNKPSISRSIGSPSTSRAVTFTTAIKHRIALDKRSLPKHPHPHLLHTHARIKAPAQHHNARAISRPAYSPFHPLLAPLFFKRLIPPESRRTSRGLGVFVRASSQLLLRPALSLSRLTFDTGAGRGSKTLRTGGAGSGAGRSSEALSRGSRCKACSRVGGGVLAEQKGSGTSESRCSSCTSLPERRGAARMHNVYGFTR